MEPTEATGRDESPKSKAHRTSPTRWACSALMAGLQWSPIPSVQDRLEGVSKARSSTYSTRGAAPPPRDWPHTDAAKTRRLNDACPTR